MLFVMNFAHKILEKYGWKDGDGLGKNNNGIAKPIKASLKFDGAGFGVDKAQEFNNHWWERVFNEAAKNVEIKKDGDKVSVNLQNDESVEITTKDYSVRKLKKKNKGSYDNFLLTSTLTNTGNEVSQPDKVVVDEIAAAPCKVLTDEELFEACGGRTAHKGARHGLKLSGKLARIEQQEKEMLLKLQCRVSEEPSTLWTVVKNKKKKKNKEKVDDGQQPSMDLPEAADENDDSKVQSMLYTNEYCLTSKKKKKEKKRTENELSDCLGSFSIEPKHEDHLGICDTSKNIKKSKKEKSKKKQKVENWGSYRDGGEKTLNDSIESGSNEKNTETLTNEEVEDFEGKVKKKKSKKCKHGIDKEAKEARKKAKKLKKTLKAVTQDLEQSALVGT